MKKKERRKEKRKKNIRRVHPRKRETPDRFSCKTQKHPLPIFGYMVKRIFRYELEDIQGDTQIFRTFSGIAPKGK